MRYILFFRIIEYSLNNMKKIYFLIILIACGDFLFAQAPAPTANPDFFPIAVWMQQTRHAKEYKKAGINMYVGIWDGLDQPQLTDLKNAGMKVMCDQNAFALSKLTDTLIYGWTQGDEPDNAQWNATTNSYDPCIDPAVIINKYNSIKAKDNSRPVYLNLGQGVSNINWVGRGTCTGKTDMYPVYKNGYVKGSDIVSYDIYPVNNTDVTKEKLWYVSKGVDSLKVWSEDKKPVWCWIEVTKIDNKTSNRQPQPYEVKAEVWLALVHGATGFGYFCHSWAPTLDDAALLNDTTMLPAVTAINKQIAGLAPILNSPTIPNFVQIKIQSSADPTVNVDVMTKKYGNSHYIFAVTNRRGTVSARFIIGTGKKVEVVDENRTLTVSPTGYFTDDFLSHGVHIYKVTDDASGVNENGSQHTIMLYPNPVKDILNIKFLLPLKNLQYEIFDVLGKRVFTGTVKNTTISVSELAKGSYTIVFNNGAGNPEVHRFFKE